jgi:hypothetical protein
MEYTLELAFGVLYATVIFLVLPTAFVRGWIKWIRRRTSETPLSLLSFMGFGLSVIADDNRVVKELLQELLEASGWHVCAQAENGSDANFYECKYGALDNY